MRLPRPPFPLIGLTGGIASGKTTVANLLSSRGWAVLDADQAAREVVAPGSEGLLELAKSFGQQVLAEDGSLDRKSLGRAIFSNSQARARLEAMLHPRIEAWLARQLESLSPETRGAAVEASLWVERGLAHHFDELWLVSAPEPLRLARIQSRDGLDAASALARLKAQSGDPEKRLHASVELIADGRDLLIQLSAAEAHCMADWSARRRRIWSHTMSCPFSPSQLQALLSTLLSRGGLAAEVFVEHRKATALGMDDGRMEDVLAGETFGASLRLVEGDATRFADLIAPSFEELQSAAESLAAPGQGTQVPVPELVLQENPTPSPVEIDPATVAVETKVSLVKKADAFARAHSERLRPGALRQVALGYGDSTQHVWIASTEAGVSTLTSDRRVQGVFRIQVTVGEGDQLQTGFDALGETRGFELFREEAVHAKVQEAVRLALLSLDAQPAPAGTFPVILASSAGGTMIHEACGHGLEADLALAGMSAFAGKLGEKVAADGVTIVDDGTLPHKRGSSGVDDEGIPTQRVVLIENGVLKNYLQSRRTARRMGVPPTGNGRRESYRHIPIPRMRNTFLAPGKLDPSEILRDLDRGLLIKHMGGGQVDTVTGNFVFQITEGYWVEKGEIRHPIKSATLAGCGPDVLKELTAIGSDLTHFDIGTCGKDGQGVPVSDALPTILCPALVVGGTGEDLETN